MGRNAGRAALGGCLGAVIGIVLGGGLGYLLADAYQPEGFFDFTRVFILFLAILLGAIGGAALGAAIAARSRADESIPMPDIPAPEARPGPPAPPESTDAELARLKERVAELEERKRREELPGQPPP
jgi:hypothetical protein